MVERLTAGSARAARSFVERDALVLAVILALATAVRFIGLEVRGRFDGDQGHDMLVLLRLVRDGELPLLGPPTSIGDFHHGAAYYYLLAPAAWLSGANPMAVVAWIAALGVAAVGVTWWSARSIGGRVPAAIAALLMAVSPAAIEESTFIWNPNPIPLFAALALGCAWRAHARDAARWWIPAVLAAGMVMQLHVLGVVFLPPILALALVDALRAARAERAGDRGRTRAGAIARAVATGLALAALLFIPLLAHELRTDFSETRRAVAYFAAGGGEGGLGPIAGLAITLFRLVGWPLVGLVTDAPTVAIVVVSATIVLAAWLMLSAESAGAAPAVRTAARWLGLTVLWSAVALALLAPSLQAVVAGLPNDHYHAFIDPVVFVLLALAMGSIGRTATTASAASGSRRLRSAVQAIVVVALGLLVFVAIRLWPPMDPNGGWPAARNAGERIVAAAGKTSLDIRGLPVFKTAEGVGFPVVAAGGAAVASTDEDSALRPLEPGATLVITCDRLFEVVIGAACGGPAEDAYLRRLGAEPGDLALDDRFALSGRIVVTVLRRISTP